MSKANSTGKKGSKLKIIIVVAVIALIAAFIVMMISSASMMSGIAMAETAKLEKKDIENTISVSGLVESRTFKQVSANLAYNVETVNVEVGDKVKAGDILAVLNSDDLQDQIVQKQAAINSSNITTEYSISDAEKNYIETRDQINDGTYPEIRNAKMSLDNAKDALEKAMDKYNEQLEISGSDRDSQLKNAQASVDSAKYELECAEADLKEIKNDIENEDYNSIKELKKAYEDAKKEYDTRYSSVKNTELNAARDKYESALSNYSYLSSLSSYSPELVSAAELEASKEAYTSAQKKLAELEAKYNVENTEDTYENALEAYTSAKADIDSSNSTKLNNAERTYERAKNTHSNAINNLNAVKDGNNTSIDSYSTAVSDAQRTVNDATESYELAVKNAENTLAKLKSAADREKVLSENDTQIIALNILKEKLDDCVITAPCDGTITAVNAIEGSAATGVLFIIEDLDNLKMTATVKEYSIKEIKPGLGVTVTIPSLDNKEFEGEVSKVSPTGIKGVDGKSDGTSSFKVEVLINGTKDQGVLIGMTSKCTAVTESAENVFAIGYDALVEDADGSCSIYVPEMIENGNGTATAKKIPVTTGFESDAEIEIISDELTEGMEIITNAGDMTDGGVIMVMSAFGDAVQSAAGASAQ